MSDVQLNSTSQIPISLRTTRHQVMSQCDTPVTYVCGTTMSYLTVNDLSSNPDYSYKHTTTPSSSSSSPLPTPSAPKPPPPSPQQRTATDHLSLSQQQASEVQENSDSFEVFQAKFKYDPVKFSPNDNPDLELSFDVGDYIFIYGEPDEDGFYMGETMDGKRGYVPSNFVEKVPDETMIAIKSSLVVQRILSPPTKPTQPKPSNSPRNLPTNHEITTVHQRSKPIPPHPVHESSMELNICELVDSKEPAPPKDLRVERQLANSVMIAWNPPIFQTPSVDNLKSYSVYVNGHLQCLVDVKDRTKALLERIELSKVHRVSVRCNYSNHLDSADQQCTIMIGTGINCSPTDFHVSHVTSSTAEVSWMPSNSNLEHIMLVDSRCRAVIRPGQYRCIITGLLADTRHSISIQPKVDSTCSGSTKICITFKTLPSEIPDAPIELQVEPGPRQGTLLVMWAPVKPNGKPPNSAINGYCIYVDGKKVKELHSPSGDHVLLESEDFLDVLNPRQLTIRSKTHGHESPDSLPFILSSKLLSELSFNTLTEQELALNSFYMTSQRAPASAYDPDLRYPSIHHPREARLSHHEASFSAQQLSPLEKRNAQENAQKSLTDQMTGLDQQQRLERCRTPSKLESYEVSTRDQLDNLGGVRDNVSDSSFDAEENFRGRHLPGLRMTNQNSLGTSANPLKPRQSRQQSNLQTEANFARDGMSKRSLKKDGQQRGSSRARYFLALFDYDPATMSPNPDGINEELPFKEGQIIKIHGTKDADGFYLGELSNGMRGLVPSNMISEIDDSSTNTQIAARKSRQGFVGSNTLPHQSSLNKYINRNPSLDPYSQQQRHQNIARDGQTPYINTGAPRQMVAIQNFDPIVHPPNRDIEPGLAVRAGEVITVHGAVDCNGYYRGEKNGAFGLVPADFLQEMVPNEFVQQHQQQANIPTNQIRSRHESYSTAHGPMPPNYLRDHSAYPNSNPASNQMFNARNENLVAHPQIQPGVPPNTGNPLFKTFQPNQVPSQQQQQQQYFQQQHQPQQTLQHHQQAQQQPFSQSQNQATLQQSFPLQQQPHHLPQTQQPLPQAQQHFPNLQQSNPAQHFQQNFQQPQQNLQHFDQFQPPRNQGPMFQHGNMNAPAKPGSADNFGTQQRNVRPEFDHRPMFQPQNVPQQSFQQPGQIMPQRLPPPQQQQAIFQQQQPPVFQPQQPNFQQQQQQQQPQQNFSKQFDQFNR